MRRCAPCACRSPWMSTNCRRASRPRCRADFLCQGGVLVEVKRGAVRRPLLLDQLRRYAALPEVASLVVVTERTVDLPRRVGGKPCAVVALNRLWGVAIG